MSRVAIPPTPWQFSLLISEPPPLNPQPSVGTTPHRDKSIGSTHIANEKLPMLANVPNIRHGKLWQNVTGNQKHRVPNCVIYYAAIRISAV